MSGMPLRAPSMTAWALSTRLPPLSPTSKRIFRSAGNDLSTADFIVSLVSRSRGAAPLITMPTCGVEHSVWLITASSQRARQSVLTSGVLNSPAHFASASSTVHVPAQMPSQIAGCLHLARAAARALALAAARALLAGARAHAGARSGDSATVARSLATTAARALDRPVAVAAARAVALARGLRLADAVAVTVAAPGLLRRSPPSRDPRAPTNRRCSRTSS